MADRILFTAKSQVELSSFEPTDLQPNQVRVRTTHSLISTGTEGICLHQLYEPDTHWDHWVKHPFATGYCLLGTVSEIGSTVTKLQIGRRVVTRATHASEAVVSEDTAFAVPDEVSDDEALWFALAMIGFMGAKAGGFKLGDSVLVVGAGPVGQMALRWAVAAGARHAVILDPIQMRLDMAIRGGATGTIESTIEAADVESAFGGELPRVVVDATGNAPLFEQCLKLPRHSGTLVLLGDTGTPSKQHLTLDVVRRGIQIHGAHVSHETPEWTERTVIEMFFDFLRRKRFAADGLITHRFSPDQCKEAYALTTEKRSETMGVVFDW